MTLGPHAGFIVAAYAAAVILIATLLAWIIVDHRILLRILADLEEQGTARRSARWNRSA